MSNNFSFEGLSEELKAALKGCTTMEELEKVLAETGLQLDNDALKAVAGGLGLSDSNMCRTYKCVHVMLARSKAETDRLASDSTLAGICKSDFCVLTCRVDQN